MSKKVKITATDVGTDIGLINIYHTELTSSNLLTSSVSGSQLLTSGFEFLVDDSITVFIAESADGQCLNYTGSINVSGEDQTSRFYRVYSDGNGTVQANTPFSIGPTTSSFSASVDHSVYPIFVIEATATYPYEFDGWYDAPSGGQLITTGNPLSLGLNPVAEEGESVIAIAFPTGSDYYAYFS